MTYMDMIYSCTEQPLKEQFDFFFKFAFCWKLDEKTVFQLFEAE